jgi:tripartite-type tricarboxylate transporter receptor subunit TctC
MTTGFYCAKAQFSGAVMARTRRLPLIVTGVLLALSAVVHAQDYPTKPIRLIVPFPAGGLNDVVGRIVANGLSARLGKQVIVENRGGAGGTVGTEAAANAPKDGYTLLVISIASTVNPHLYKLPYEPVKSFAPVAVLVTVPTTIVVNPTLPVHSVQELIGLVKQRPGELQYSSSGVGASLHLAGELFKLMAGVDMVHVPFRGSAPALIDTMGGHTKVAFGSLTSIIPHVRGGKLRALGIAAAARSPALPELPTVAEQGLPGYEAGNWIGIVAPAGTPPAIVERLHREIAAIQDAPETQKQFAAEGAEVVRMTPAQFGAFMADELVKWGRVVKESGIKAE